MRGTFKMISYFNSKKFTLFAYALYLENLFQHILNNISLRAPKEGTV